MNKYRFVIKPNECFELSPLRFQIITINSDDPSAVPLVNDDLFAQIKVPALTQFEAIHDMLRGYTITGFTLDNNVVYINYSNITHQEIDHVLEHLRSTTTSHTLLGWIDLIKNLNGIKVYKHII